MQRHAGREVALAGVVVDESDAEMELQIRTIDVRPAPDEAAGFRPIGGQHSAAVAQKIWESPASLNQEWNREADQPGSFGAQICSVVAMVLKVVADPRRIADDLDPVTLQLLGRPDPRDHQQLRRAEGAAGHNDLAPRIEQLLRVAAANDHAARPPAFERDAARLSVRKDRQIRQRRGLQIGSCGIVSASILLEQLVGPDALLAHAVEIGVALKSRLNGRLDESVDRRIAVAEIADVKRPGDAMPGVRAADRKS